MLCTNMMECHSMLNAFIKNFIFKDSLMASKTVQNMLCRKADYKTVYHVIPIRETEMERERENLERKYTKMLKVIISVL